MQGPVYVGKLCFPPLFNLTDNKEKGNAQSNRFLITVFPSHPPCLLFSTQVGESQVCCWNSKLGINGSKETMDSLFGSSLERWEEKLLKKKKKDREGAVT